MSADSHAGKYAGTFANPYALLNYHWPLRENLATGGRDVDIAVKRVSMTMIRYVNAARYQHVVAYKYLVYAPNMTVVVDTDIITDSDSRSEMLIQVSIESLYPKSWESIEPPTYMDVSASNDRAG